MRADQLGDSFALIGTHLRALESPNRADVYTSGRAPIEMESAAEGGNVRRTASGFKALPYNIPRGSIAAYYPETNGLLPLSYHDKKSKTPSAKVDSSRGEAEGRPSRRAGMSGAGAD